MLVLTAEGSFKMSIGDVVSRGVVMLELLVDNSQRLTARQEVGRQYRPFGLESDPARRLTLGDADQRVGELAVQGAQRVARVALEVVDVGVLVLDREDPLLGHVRLVA